MCLRFSRLLAIALSFAACTTSGEKKVLNARDRILGKTPRPAAEPFQIDASVLSGPYVSDSFFNRDKTAYLGAKVASHEEAWNFTDATVDVYDAAKDQDCGARPWHVEGLNTIATDATTACPAKTYTAVAQQPSDGSLTLIHDPFAEDGKTYDHVILRKVDAKNIAADLIRWDSAFAQAPTWLQTFVPKEPTAAAVKTARDGFKSTALGGTLKLQGDFTASVVSDASPEVKILTFEGGKALATFWDESDEPEAVTCHVIAPKETGDLLAKGFQFAIASITLKHPRRDDGTWTLTGSKEVVAANPYRDDTVGLTFAGAPDGLYLGCSKDASLTPISAADVQSAFGAALVFSK